MATASNKQSNTFDCAGCIETGQPASHPHPATRVGGIKYCRFCAEERQDELAIKVRELLRKRALRWGKHYLSINQYPVKDELVTADDVVANELAARVLGQKCVPMERGFFTLDVICYCNGNHSHVDLFRSYGQFWQAFSKFCNAHYDQLKPLVK